MESFGLILYVASHDTDADIRLECCKYVFLSQWAGLEAFLVAMSFDPDDDIRQLTLEGLGLREFPSLNFVAKRLINDSNPNIKEQADAMLNKRQWHISQL
jgi:hypothetical protein